LAVNSPAPALIKIALPLEAIVHDSEFVLLAEVDKIDPTVPQVVLAVREDLKGKAPFRRLAVHFQGNMEAKKLNHAPQLLKRVAPGLPLVVTVNVRDKFYDAFAYTNGTWFRLSGQKTGDAGQVTWRLANGEPVLRRTYSGTTAELRQLLIDRLADKAKLPAVNEKEEPGFGPEVTPTQPDKTGTSRLPSRRAGPLFAVIPTLGVGAPLVVLAALFPAVFGGVLVLFRQWVAFITVFSVNSMFLLLHWLLNTYYPAALRGSWLGSEAGLWFLMTLVVLAGTVWAWKRQLARQGIGEMAIEAPRRTELTVLWSLAGLCSFVSVLTPLVSRMLIDRYDARADLAWMLMVVLTFGILAAAVYRTARDRVGAQPALATEGVMLAGILLGHLGYTAYRWGGDDLGSVAGANEGTSQPSTAVVNRPHAPTPPKVRVLFSPKSASGIIVATPLVHGNEVYVAAARPSYGQGTLYCLDRETGKPKWEFFGEDGDLRQMISGPTVADGKIFLGEGFHDDPNCRLFCIDAREGKQLWAIRTTGQTECSPCVAGGKVLFGAGNDGLYCLGAGDGKEQWRFPPQPHKGRLLRCGSTPAVLGNRVYAGSAVDRNQKDDPGETAIFCLDIETGQPHWKHATKLPAWAAPVLNGGHAFYALGNGDVFGDAVNQDPAGAMLCVDLPSGKEVWRYDVPNGVLDSPAVDGERVYFGCRDGHLYCVGRYDGKLRWKASLDAPVVASPVLARCPGYAQTAHVFAVSTSGKVACLDPTTGDLYWSVALTDREAHFSAAPRVVVSRTDAGDRRLLFVAGGIGGLVTGRPVVFCLEDFVPVE
jgi:outer membrane protein assembly factor BamB